jgi:hypothetical protein
VATEITCVLRSSSNEGSRLACVGGPGWTQDIETVIGAIEEGWRYYIRIGSAQVNVVLAAAGPCPLRSDPSETAENELLTLPACLLNLGTAR